MSALALPGLWLPPMGQESISFADKLRSFRGLLRMSPLGMMAPNNPNGPVTFGTLVKAAPTAVGTSFALPSMSGVTSGQPIIVVLSASAGASNTYTISDNFSTPYTWTSVVTTVAGGTISLFMFIGTGGAGTSGTVTATIAAGPGNADFPFTTGFAVPCIGASTAAGLSAIDVSGHVDNTAGGSLSLSMTPTAVGEGAVYAYSSAGGTLSTPAGPWVTSVELNSNSSANTEVSTYNSPASGSALTVAYTNTASGTGSALGCIVKA